MQILECPYCATRVSNDGSLSEMVVTCPGCWKQFQMPAFSAQPPSPPAESRDSSSAVEEEHAPPSDEEAPRPRKKQEGRRGPPLWLAIVGSTVVFWVMVAIVWWVWGSGWFSRSGANKPNKSKRPTKDAVQPKEGKPVRPPR
jgi:hypothetical protein